MKNIKELFVKYKELLLYVVFGVGTTVVNFLGFSLFDALLGDTLYLVSNGLAWFVAVVFAYLTNKLWVFESKSWHPAVIGRELVSFFAARVLSFGIEEAGLLLLVELLGFGGFSVALGHFTLSGTLLAKALLAVIVVILNYFFSKLFIFKKKAS